VTCQRVCFCAQYSELLACVASVATLQHGAPVLVQCGGRCKERWHVQCIAPDAVPGDQYDFCSGGWECERCREWDPGSSPLAPLTLSDLPAKAQDAEGILALLDICYPGEIGIKVCKVRFGTDIFSGGSSGVSGGASSSAAVAMEEGAQEMTAGCVKWVAEDVWRKVPEPVQLKYYNSPKLGDLVDSARGSLIYYVDTPLRPPLEAIIKRMWRFRSNGQYFGVTQYLNAFTPDEIRVAEQCIDEALVEQRELYHDAEQVVKAATEELAAAEECVNALTEHTEAHTTAVQAVRLAVEKKRTAPRLPPQLHKTGDEKRFKLFYGRARRPGPPKLAAGASNTCWRMLDP